MSDVGTKAVERAAPSGEPPIGSPRTGRPSDWARAIDRRVLSMVLVFVVLAVIFHWQSDGIFFTSRNLSLLLRQAAPVAVVAAGVSMLMIMAEIDLSIGSAVFLTGVVAAELQVVHGAATVPAVLAAIVAGAVLGAWQGFWVVRLAVPSFIVTLAGLLAFRGIGLLWTNAATVSPLDQSFVSLAESFISPTLSYVILAGLLAACVGAVMRSARFGRHHGIPVRVEGLIVRLLVTAASFAFLAWIAGGFLGIPMALVWVAGVGIVLGFVMARTTFGRNAYLIGSNREAAVLAGINVRMQVFIGFVLMGVIYGIGGVLLTARLGSSTASSGTNLELDAIAAAVIGGTSLAGGVGTVAGAMAGALLLATIDNGMGLINFSSFAQLVVKGGVLLIALALDSFTRARRRA